MTRVVFSTYGLSLAKVNRRTYRPKCNYLINRVFELSDVCFGTQSFEQNRFADCFITRLSQIVCSATFSSAMFWGFEFSQICWAWHNTRGSLVSLNQDCLLAMTHESFSMKPGQWSLSQPCVTLASCALRAWFHWKTENYYFPRYNDNLPKIINVILCDDVCLLFDEVHPSFPLKRTPASWHRDGYSKRTWHARPADDLLQRSICSMPLNAITFVVY